MMNARFLARSALLSIGLAIGAATPGIASAEDLDFQISIDGYDLFSTTGNTATATSGMGDIAIAFGDGANADATGGFGDFASATGAGSQALTSGNRGGDFDTAMATGADSQAEADGGDLDGAFASGTFSDVVSGSNGEGSSDNIDFASAFGDYTRAGANAGSFNTALVFDPTSTALSDRSVAIASFGNDDSVAVFGDKDIAFDGGTGDAPIIPGSNDIALIFGTDSEADVSSSSTTPGDFDLGTIFANNAVGDAATGGNYLYDIVSALGSESGTAAATSGSSFLTELLSLF